MTDNFVTASNQPPRVFIYTQTLPAPTGSGAEVRIWTNLRAYLDLGFRARVWLMGGAAPLEPTVQGLDCPVEYAPIDPPAPALRNKIGFWIRRPLSWELDYSFPFRRCVRTTVQRNEGLSRGSIHHFEYLGMASALIPRLEVTTVFSSLDLEFRRMDLIRQMRLQLGQGNRNRLYRMFRRASIKRTERLAVANATLVVGIAEHECEYMRSKWGATTVELLPMSCPDEERVWWSRPRPDDDCLRLLHIGSVDAFVGFHSLEVLLKDVLPRLSPKTLSKLKLDVVGRISDRPTSKIIRKLAAPYPSVQFHGFQSDLRAFYAQTDLHVVAAPSASGLRTRIVESLARGLPVLSLTASAEGLFGVSDGQNVLLAGSSVEFSEMLEHVAINPDCLVDLSNGGRRLYDARYCRRVASETLAHCLNRHVQEID